MKALYAHAAHDLRLEPCEDAVPEPGHVAIRMRRGGICGSDLHYYHHGGFGTVRLREPMILGHEVAGEVSALGDGVTGLSVGDLVAVSPSRPCGDCGECLRGLPNQCLNMRFYGSAMPFPHIQGAFRQELIVDAAQCAPAGSLAPGQAAMAEPLAVTLHATRRAGAREIVATDLAPFTLAKATEIGADRVLNMAEEPDAMSAYTADKGY